jgi:hypothetical protein
VRCLEGFDYPYDLSHDLSERAVYIPFASLCYYDQQRAITPSEHRVLVAESLTKNLLLAVIQQRLSGMSNIINRHKMWSAGRLRTQRRRPELTPSCSYHLNVILRPAACNTYLRTVILIQSRSESLDTTSSSLSSLSLLSLRSCACVAGYLFLSSKSLIPLP